MTTYTPFAPNPSVAFSFNPVLDGVTYLATVTWNIFGARWYLNLFTLQGALVLSEALTASPQKSDIDLVEGYFDSSLVFRDHTQQFEVSP